LAEREAARSTECHVGDTTPRFDAGDEMVAEKVTVEMYERLF